MKDDQQQQQFDAQATVLRLVRCMTIVEQTEMVQLAIEILGKRCSFDPHHKRLSPEDLRHEIENEDLDERLLLAWPGNWPGRSIVELDNLGDPGAWLSEVFGEPILEVLFDCNGADDRQAKYMAQDYLQQIRAQGFPLPSDFDEDPTYDSWTADDERQVQLEFVGFLQRWRQRVLTALEQQTPPIVGSGPDG